MDNIHNIYVAGPMTGRMYFNFDNFDRVKKDLERQGWDVFSPADNDRRLLGFSDDWMPDDRHHDGNWKVWNIPNAPGLRKMLGDDLAWISSEAHAIYMMKGWQRSFGCLAEHALAVALGLEIIYESD